MKRVLYSVLLCASFAATSQALSPLTFGVGGGASTNRANTWTQPQTFSSTFTVTGPTVSINGLTYYWPSGGQAASDVLTTNGSGTLSWDAVSAGVTAGATTTWTGAQNFASTVTFNSGPGAGASWVVMRGSSTDTTNDGFSFDANAHMGVGSVGIGTPTGAIDSTSGDMLSVLYSNGDTTARTKGIGIRNAQTTGTAQFAAGTSTTHGQVKLGVNAAGNATPVAFITTVAAYPLRIATNGAAVTAPVLEVSSYTTVNVFGAFIPYRRTSAQLEAITPTGDGIGWTYYCTDCSPKGLYSSTGPSAGAFLAQDGVTPN